MKRITSPYYTFEKIGIDYFGRNTKLPNECLYSKGMYATKITESDLPEWYVDGIIYKRYGFLSTIGVKQNSEALKIWEEGMKAMIEQIEPSTILVYGGELEFDYGDINVIYFDNKVTKEWRNRKG